MKFIGKLSKFFPINKTKNFFLKTTPLLNFYSQTPLFQTDKHIISENKKIPLHLGFIVDGNRRFARNVLKKPVWRGHEEGVKKIEDLQQWVEDCGYNIEMITIYSFSVENFGRPTMEKKFLFQLFDQQLSRLIEKIEKVHEKGAKFHFLGRTELFDEYNKSLREKMEKVEEMTKNNTQITINFCVAYGGQSEIVDSIKKIITDIKNNNIDEKKFFETFNEKEYLKYLDLKHVPDLIVRTGGRKRVSNFLLYQNAYSEWFFLDKLWPEFSKEDFISILEEFFQRQRTYGY